MESVFTRKDLKKLQSHSNAISREQLIQKLVDPPRRFRPSTNMNKTGQMTALRLTYEDSRQYEMGVSKNVSEVRTAYAVKKKNAEVLKVCPKRNTYINHPNKSQDILRNVGNEASRLLEKIDQEPTDAKAASKKGKAGAAQKAAKRPPMRPESMGVKSKRRVIQGGA